MNGRIVVPSALCLGAAAADAGIRGALYELGARLDIEVVIVDPNPMPLLRWRCRDRVAR